MAAGAIRARDLGVPVTVHAGEWPEKFGTVENVRSFTGSLTHGAHQDPFISTKFSVKFYSKLEFDESHKSRDLFNLCYWSIPA